MGSNAEVKDASYFGPVGEATPTADGKTGNNTVRYASSNTASSQALAVNTIDDGRSLTLWSGKFVDVKNESLTDSLEFCFSVAAVTLVYGTTSTFEAGSAVAGWRLDPGQTISVICPPNCKFANWILGAAGPSTVAFRCSEGNVGTK
jgi:hypothetical protein